MRDTYRITKNGRLLLTLTYAGVSETGYPAFRAKDEIDGALQRYGRWFREFDCDATREELISEKVHVYRNGQFVPHHILGRFVLRNGLMLLKPSYAKQHREFSDIDVNEDAEAASNSWVSFCDALVSGIETAADNYAKRS